MIRFLRIPDFSAHIRSSDSHAPIGLHFGSPRSGLPLRGETWVSQVTGLSSSYVPRPDTPPTTLSPRPRAAPTLLPSAIVKAWAVGNHRFRG